MTIQVTNYQCPACTGPLHFAPESGKLECDYCGSIYEVAEIETLYREKEEKAIEAAKEQEKKAISEDGWDMSLLNSDWGTDGNGMKVYICPSCGAELICDGNTAATSCPYCNNPTVVPGQFDGILKPDFVIPFKMTKEKAVEALKNHYKGKFFLPKLFSKENHIQEIQGVYVPFWLFDGAVEGAVHYNATMIHEYDSGDYEVTETEYYRLLREGSLAFEKIPVDASSKMPDEHMDSIEPYNYGELKDFSTAYLPGYLADKYDVSVEQCMDRIDKRCQETLISAFGDTIIGYTSCVADNKNIDVKRGKVHYALLPVWMLNTKWNGKDYLFAMNGQTGKLVGDLPIDKKKYWLTYAAIAGPLSILGTLLMLLIM